MSMATGKVESIVTNAASISPATDRALKYHTEETPYTLPTGTDESEWARLNAQHYGIKSYWGSNSAGANWPKSPKKILELGLGTGVWALEVAAQFPGSEVIGVDIIEPNLETKPANFSFHRLNVVTDPWPFESGSFDIVHCRFLAMHLPNFRDLVKKAIDATAPNGILMFEDPALVMRSVDKAVPSPVALFFAIYQGHSEANGVNCRTGPEFLPIIRDSKQFSEIHETIVPAPMGDWTEDEKLNSIGLGLQVGLIEGARFQNPRLYRFGMTKEIVEGMCQELLKKENHLCYDMYFVWARKRKTNL
ncbi:S-adenosyl-L-methionine-dependent methyltransferase [Calocera cornea HHB12733]|uniref:S-adenosyl-L-methionine-dependent methyltransferase n=1 Tax=Calocera cornea HHB12733 TaxID=1353952 RepID=A0A165FG07_9BASI|nr:S-adenosyl-L-methionine-dependent methyltransferase [Calocera cornea HHB12733]